MHRCAVIGTGTWGTAMAVQLASCGQKVMLWGRDQEKCAHMAATRRHPLLDLKLPDGLRVSADPRELASCPMLYWAVPTQYSAAIARHLRPHLDSTAHLVSLSKGLEEKRLLTVCELLARELGHGHDILALSGPSHAEEVVAGLPTGMVAAGSASGCERIVEQLHGRSMRIYTCEDRLGVELAAALKNVIAIAAGTCDGLNLGHNAKATLVTRGLAEIRRLGRTLFCDEATFAGLAGMGDLLTTCYSPYGRNRALGQALAQGHSMESHAAGSGGMVAEGAWTCRAAVALAAEHGIEMPIADQVARVVWQGLSVRDGIEALLARSAKQENA